MYQETQFLLLELAMNLNISRCLLVAYLEVPSIYYHKSALISSSQLIKLSTCLHFQVESLNRKVDLLLFNFFAYVKGDRNVDLHTV